jgi:hypothetical protein
MAAVDLLDWLIPDKSAPWQMPAEKEAKERGSKLVEAGLSPMQISRVKREGGSQGAQLCRKAHTPVSDLALGVSSPETIIPFTQRGNAPVNSNNQIHVSVLASPGQSPEFFGKKSTIDNISKVPGLPDVSISGVPDWDND